MTLEDFGQGDLLAGVISADSDITLSQISQTEATETSAATLTLHFSGNASPEQYQELLRSIYYSSDSVAPWRRDPDLVASSRTDVSITWRVDDEFAPVTIGSSFTFVNLNPEIKAGSGHILGVTDPLPIDALLDVSDPDNVQLSSAQVLIDDYQIGDLLVWDTSLASAAGVQVEFNQNPGELSITGVADATDYQELLRSVTFDLDWDLINNPTGSSRSISWQVSDANTDTRGIGISDSHTIQIQLASISSTANAGLAYTGTVQEDDGNIQNTGPLDVVSGNPSLPVFSTNIGQVTQTGKLSVSDSDFGQSAFSSTVIDWPGSAITNIGALDIAADGNWTYTLDNSHPLIQTMRPGDQRVESFLVESLDGTARQRVDITIEGSEDLFTQYAS